MSSPSFKFKNDFLYNQDFGNSMARTAYSTEYLHFEHKIVRSNTFAAKNICLPQHFKSQEWYVVRVRWCTSGLIQVNSQQINLTLN